MPGENEGDTGKGGGDGKGGSYSEDGTATKTLEIDLGGSVGKKQFANLEELQNEFAKLHGAAATVVDEKAKLAKENAELQNVKKLGRAAVMTGSVEAERQFYGSLGISEEKVIELMQGGGKEEEEEEDEKAKGGGKGQMPSVDEIAEAVLGKLTEGKRLKFSHLDDESFGLLQEMSARIEAASSVVAETSQDQIEKKLAADPVIDKYWGALTDRQKSVVLKHTLDTAGRNIAKGRRPSSGDVQKMRDVARTFLANVYGPPETLRKGDVSKVPTALDLGGESTEYEGLSDEELAERIEKLSIPDTEGGKGPAGLRNRMMAKFESLRRARK